MQRRGIFSQDGMPWGEAACIEREGRELFLAPLSAGWLEDVATGQPALFQVCVPTGIIYLQGLPTGCMDVAVNGVTHRTLRLTVDPTAVERVNRRAHYRVSSLMKGEIAFLAEEEPAGESSDPGQGGAGAPLAQGSLKALAERRPCLIRDLSLGGARLSLPSPPPRPGRRVLLDLALAPKQVLGDVPATVVEVRPGAHPSPLDAEARIRFESLAPAAESRLARYINGLQLEMLKKGIRG